VSLVTGEHESLVVSSVWKASLRTMCKLLDLPAVLSALNDKHVETQLDPNILVEVFLAAKLDPVDHAEEEQKILLKQQVILKIAEKMELSEGMMVVVFKAIVKEVKTKSMEDVDGVYSSHFGEAAKRNASRIIEIAASNGSQGAPQVIQQIMLLLCSKIKKQFKKLQSIDVKKGANNIRLKDYQCFLIKILEDAIRKLADA
jgi:hypothetical protein